MKMNIHALPKVDLHFHLDGSVRPSTIKEIALAEGIKLPAEEVEQLASFLQVKESCNDLSEYLSTFELPVLCLQTAQALERVAYEAVEDASKQNIKYLEIRFAPQLHTDKGLTLEEIVSSVLAGMKNAGEAFGVRARLLLTCLRSHSLEKTTEVVETARKFLGQGVVGVDLAGDEAGYPPQLHREAFRLAHRYDIPITVHAGEAAGAENIREAIVNMHAKRIGHGVRLRENRELLHAVKKNQIALEMCPTSNVQTKAVSSWREHPIREYYDHGILVTVNTDNTTVSNTTITQEYEKLVQLYQFSLEDLKRIIMNALAASFLEEPERKKLIAEFQHAFSSPS
jgi:adenosine deaminase